MFGLIGAHRTGKTTLARILAEKMGIYYFQVSTSEIMREGGFDAVSDMDLEERLDAQEFLLLRFLEMTEDIPKPFLSDRTPIDMAAYMLADINMHNATADQSERAARYAHSCLIATMGMFDALIVTRPLEWYDEAPDKPPYSPAYQMHIQTLIEGMAYHMLSEQVTVGFLHSSDLTDRVEASYGLLMKRLDEIRSERELSRIH